MSLHTWAFSMGRTQVARVRRDFDCLMERMHRRLYPETVHVLAFYWLKTIGLQRYQPAEWDALDQLLQEAAAGQSISVPQAVQCIADLREWIPQFRHGNGQPSRQPMTEPTREVNSNALPLYLFRLLNEWLPVEVAHLLVSEPPERSDESGNPVIVVARAIERLLLREHLSRATQESMLLPGLLSPRFVYPADFEILQDVLLFVLGRTGASAPAKLPAALLWVAADAPLSLAYSDAVRAAILTAGPSELHVPIPPSQATELVKKDHVRITSALVTSDGQLWHADRLQRDEQDSIIYRPAGQLRIDYSRDHARMTLPWPESRQRWSGTVSFSNRLEVFGHAWHISHWEQDSERTLLHLEFVDSLPMTAIEPGAKDRLRRSHPAAIDMAWAALERALAASMIQRNLEPVEQLRRAELVPLGRALFGLAETLMTRRLRTLDGIDRRLKGIRYLSAELLPVYGPVPWRILPEAVRRILLGAGIYGSVADLLHEVFEGLPEGQADRVPPGRYSNGPSRAA